MEYALGLAEKAAELGEVPIGAVIVRDNKVIGEGYNQVIVSNDPSAHAEVVAIRNASKYAGNYRLVDTTLYVTIEPCTMCFGTIVHSRIERVVFGATEPKAGVLISNKHLVVSDIYNHSFDVQGGVLETRCSETIQKFFQDRRAKKREDKKKTEKKAPKEP